MKDWTEGFFFGVVIALFLLWLGDLLKVPHCVVVAPINHRLTIEDAVSPGQR